MGGATETAAEEAARKKREEAVRKKEAAAKKKAADKKAEDAKKAKKAAEAAKEKADREKRVRDRERERRKEKEERDREARNRRSRTRSRSRPRSRRSRTRSRGRSRRSHRSRESRRSRSRSSPRSGRSRSRSLDSAALKTQVERLTEKVKYMESKKRWNSLSNEKQYLHEVKVKQLAIEDVRRLLEEQFGSKKDVPEKLTDALRKGEKEIDYRNKLLKIADKGSWTAVEKYAADPLCDDEEDDKKWKATLKEAKEDMAKKKPM